MKRTKLSLKDGKSLLKGRLPGQLVIQYSNRCNADCPQCGMRRSNDILRHTLSKKRCRELIDDGARAGVQSLSFTGGEPLLFLDDVVELINYASDAGIPYIRTGSNGFFLKNRDSPDFETRISEIAEKLASTKLYSFWISLDSAIPEDHEKLRGLPGVIKGIEKAIPIFHSHGIYPSANLGINRAVGGKDNQPFLVNMDEKEFEQRFSTSFEQFYQFVTNLGFTIVNACYPMSSDNGCGKENRDLDPQLYGAASSDSMIVFSRDEKRILFKALYSTIPKFRGKLRIFSPRCSLYSLQRKFNGAGSPLFSCRGGHDFFFAECNEGKIYPCGYLDEPFESLPDLTSRNGKLRDCDRCEWECFRDPSDLMAPFAELFTQPFTLSKKVAKDPRFFKILKDDLFYYRACDYFNGRQAPNLKKMKPFGAA